MSHASSFLLPSSLPSCEQAQALLSAAVEEAASHRQFPAAVTLHVAQCESCRHFLSLWLEPHPVVEKLAEPLELSALSEEDFIKRVMEATAAPSAATLTSPAAVSTPLSVVGSTSVASAGGRPRQMSQWRPFLHQAAAVIGLLGCAWWMLGPHKAQPLSQRRKDIIAEVITDKLMKRPADAEVKEMAIDSAKAMAHASRTTKRQMALLGL